MIAKEQHNKYSFVLQVCNQVTRDVRGIREVYSLELLAVLSGLEECKQWQPPLGDVTVPTMQESNATTPVEKTQSRDTNGNDPLTIFSIIQSAILFLQAA
jgi:hypothetical protein